MSKQHAIQLHHIQKRYDDLTVLQNLDLHVEKNEFMTLLGPSGCGKTTTLRIIGGFEAPDQGDVYLNGQKITHLPPYRRSINTVFQKYALFPHMNVADNIAFGLKIKKMSPKEIQKKIDWALSLVNLPGYASRKIDAMSGGQQQRIAIARAIVNEPEILLLDEPLGALDLKLRKDMQYELKELQRELGITFIYVTHDQEEALSMSNTVVVMNNGVIQQQGSPESIYNEPVNAFVADFIGESNIFEGTMLRDGLVHLLGHDLVCVDKGFPTNASVDVVIRPEDIEILPQPEHSTQHGYIGTVTECIFKGVHYEMSVQVDAHEWLVQNTIPYVIGSTVRLSVEPDLIHIMRKVVD